MALIENISLNIKKWYEMCQETFFYIYGDGKQRQANAWTTLLAWTVEVNILPKQRYGDSFSGRGSNTQPTDWEAD